MNLYQATANILLMDRDKSRVSRNPLI
jgi:hypothetical protein